DLYYSMAPDLLFDRLNCNLIECKSNFEKRFSVSISEFISLVKLYLSSTVVSVNGKKFIQKKGVSIGSSVAPLLSEIYLQHLDSVIFEAMSFCKSKLYAVRYVDDVLLMGESSGDIERCRSF